MRRRSYSMVAPQRRARLAAGAVVVFGCLGAHAFAASPIVKPGWWEITVTTGVSEVRTSSENSGPAIAGKHPAELPPEARKPAVAPDITNKTPECLTQSQTQTWTAFTRMDRDYGACQVRPLLNSRKQYKALLTCAGGKAHGEANFTATPTSFRGDVKVVAHESSYDRTDTKNIQAHWVRATCDANSGLGMHR